MRREKASLRRRRRRRRRRSARHISAPRAPARLISSERIKLIPIDRARVRKLTKDDEHDDDERRPPPESPASALYCRSPRWRARSSPDKQSETSRSRVGITCVWIGHDEPVKVALWAMDTPRTPGAPVHMTYRSVGSGRGSETGRTLTRRVISRAQIMASSRVLRMPSCKFRSNGRCVTVCEPARRHHGSTEALRRRRG